MRNITREFNDIGEKITIQLSYKDMEVSELPKSCMNCPVGFMFKNCGREYPLGENRPSTCKLKLINILGEAVTIKQVNGQLPMSYYRYTNYGDIIFFDCKGIGIQNVCLETDLLSIAELKAMELVQKRCDKLLVNIEEIIKS